MSTSTVSLSTVVSAIIAGDVTGYTSADASTKAKIRSALSDALRATIADESLDAVTKITRSQAIMLAESAVKSTKSTPTPKVLDLTPRAIVKITDLLGAALVLAESDTEHVDAAQVSDAVLAWFERPTVSATARKIAESNKITSKSAASVDVGAHLRQVAAQHTSGTFLTIRQVCSTVTEECPNGYEHDGAIAARLFPTSGTCSVAEVTPAREGNDSNGRRGMLVV